MILALASICFCLTSAADIFSVTTVLVVSIVVVTTFSFSLFFVSETVPIFFVSLSAWV
jgi:hypothetical protein